MKRLVLLSFLLTQALNSQDGSFNPLEELFIRAGIRKQIYFFSNALFDITNAHLKNANVLPVDKVNQPAFADSAYFEIVKYGTAYFEALEIDSLLRLYERPAFVALAAGESDTLPHDSVEIAVFFTELQKTRSYAFRLPLIERFLLKRQMLDLEKAGSVSLMRNLLAVFNVLRPLGNRLSHTQLDSAAIVLAGTTETELAQRTRNFLYQYRQLNDSNWVDFVAFYETPLGNKYLDFQTLVPRLVSGVLSRLMSTDIEHRTR